jgi:hypothetical protein
MKYSLLPRLTWMLVIGVLVLAACSPATPIVAPTPVPSQTPQPSPTAVPPTPIPTNIPTATGNSPDAAMPQDVTLAEDGGSITVTVGQSLLVDLGSDYTWLVTPSDPSVISREKDVTVMSGAQGVYMADKAGTITLTARGNPVCRTAQNPCKTPDRIFRVQVMVNPSS